MVHLGNTTSAVSAMMGAKRLGGRALLAPPPFGFDDLREDITTRVYSNSLVVCVPQDQQEAVEDNSLCSGRRTRIEGGGLENELRTVTEKCYQETDSRDGDDLDERCIVEAGHDQLWSRYRNWKVGCQVPGWEVLGDAIPTALPAHGTPRQSSLRKIADPLNP
jgi:hypothetical protein